MCLTSLLAPRPVILLLANKVALSGFCFEYCEVVVATPALTAVAATGCDSVSFSSSII